MEIKIAMEELKKIMQLRVVEYVSDDCIALPSTQLWVVRSISQPYTERELSLNFVPFIRCHPALYLASSSSKSFE